jgi:hypothetical protein
MLKICRLLGVSALAGVGFVGLSVPGASATGSSPVHAAGVTLTPVWSHTLDDGGNSGIDSVMGSSPMEINLDGSPSVVFGDGAGHIYAYNLGNGTAVPGWPASTGGVPVESTPSVNGSDIFIGAGDSRDDTGGYEAFGPNGQRLWVTTVGKFYGTDTPIVGVQASLAVGDLQGSTDVVAGSLQQNEDALSAANGAVLGGFPAFQDTNFSTPALADVYSNGRTDIVEGDESSPGVAFGYSYQQGGLLRILGPDGNIICQYQANQAVDSSPAVGEFLGGGQVGIAVGTGNTFAGASDTDVLFAFNTGCHPVWADTLSGLTTSSPALVDALGKGEYQVAEGTDNGTTGKVYLLDGSTGKPFWSKPVIGRVVGGIVSANLGGGYQDLIVPTTLGLQILDGKTGAILATYDQDFLGMQNSPLVTENPDGTIGITLAGYLETNQDGYVVHLQVNGSNGTVVNEKGAWPMFHLNPQLTGDTGTPPPVVAVPCRAPANPHGYWLDASDGGIFSFGNLPFCGSTGNVTLNKPIVGMAATRNAGGYWLVASDGGIFTFGNARFHGSTGDITLNKPIVGMAVDPATGGYWLVASDGGIFSFDAPFYGSTGGITLNKPIVGMAATPNGGGYWLVASDGGIFSFGNAHFYGSTGGITLNKPVVGMASTPDGDGYWLAASDGGIFTFGNAAFHGSTGGMTLNKPVVGMATDRATSGYWLVASDGGIFAFDAPFYGSTGGITLSQPVVGMSGF